MEIRKIAVHDGMSLVSAGENLDFCPGDLISVGRQIITFIPGTTVPHEEKTDKIVHDFGKVSPALRRANTSNIVALFLDQEKAEACTKVSNLTNADPRWKDDSIAVLRAIGTDHPLFSVTDYPGLRLIPRSEWQL